MKFIVDANVLSEPTKPEPSLAVITWLRKHERDLVVNPIVLGEIEYGILLLNPSRRRSRLEAWFRAGVSRIQNLDFDANCAAQWARLLAELKKKGRAMPVKDSLIAASALAHGLTVATRNVNDFRHTGTPVVNPFD
ncbi:hypothetical protein EI77_03165 [Prosthecobacter fusiformis]|uniref:PIN domain-containing protein n=1 Tax=Prosthecobacter fusiformis TaxID=48464 RepID=A0A4R7RSV9_9BACT|nr:PIN domain-containing protein [Prosthecobacter fusiformis]TDU68048.1 hypothetical protein EI77_03165 [Prosthecobacter fusiformis]